MKMQLRKCIILLIFYLYRTKVYCFNIEERNPIAKRGDKGTYFGFSVAQHQIDKDGDISKNWILVGAPLGQNSQPSTNKSGALFKCPITRNNDDCIQIETDGKRFDDFDYGDDTSMDKKSILEPPGVDEIKDGQWLGVTVRSQKPGGKVIVCAHRYIQSPDLNSHHYGLGLCYLLNNKLETEDDLQPCKGRPMEKLHQQYGFCQVGTSLALLNNGMALMGSPGPYTWRGTIFTKEVVGDFLEKDTTTYRGPLNDNSEPIEKYSYLGMSVTGGYFFNKTQQIYASGAPRSHLYGQVFFFKKQEKRGEELNITLILTGEQFASSYGYEILAADINKDGYDDLIVGAPFYYNDYAGGAVYIYYNLKNCTNNNCKWDMKLTGKPESRFGFSMTALGDINKDGYTDVAIGAPYENDKGAIYIYLGSLNGLNSQPSQIIKHQSYLKTVGYSLSGGLDMDGNGYPDLLVGAFESDLAILYKTRSIIDINITIKGDELYNINTTQKGCKADPISNNTCFSFKSCFVISDLKMFKNFQVNYQIMEVAQKKISRIWFRNDLHIDKRDSTNRRFIEVTNPKRLICVDETVYIKEGVSDIISPIKFLVNYTLDNNEIDSPILNKTSVKEFKATFQKNCGDDDICKSKLVLNAGTQLNLTKDGYIVKLGEDEEFLIDANITNYGEAAYEAKLFIVHPQALSYIALQNDKEKNNNVICSYENSTLVVCNLGNPFQENKSVYLRLRFEINKNTRDQKLDLYLFVNSTSVELSKNTKQRIVAVLQKIAEYAIEGKAITPTLTYAGDVKGSAAMKNFEDIGARVYHLYQIVNHGQWQLQDVIVTIWWPYQVYSDRPQGGKWLLYLENTPIIEDNENYYCYVDPPEAVNPLKLNSSGVINNEPENYTEPITFTDNNPSEMRRFKRDVEYIVKAETITGPDGKKRKVVLMDCFKRSANCARISCHIRKLSKDEQAKIKIFSRIWNSTLVEDYSNVDWVTIRSAANVTILDKTIIHSPDSIRGVSIETIAYPGIVLADTSLNIWIIIGSVLAGLLLLILLIFILYKVGFFKRNRIKDQTLSGNLKKQGESESLLNKGNEGKT